MGQKIRFFPAIAAIITLSGHSALAQEIDYGALSDMFGEPITTSATGSPQKASEAPANMQIITADQIEHSGATNIPDILRFVAGVDVRSYGALDSDVSIRGYSQAYNPRLLVLINGRQVYLDDYGYTAWQALPVQLPEIRQIEIVRGPASALFGFNAASGVINIITYDPLFDKTNTLLLSAGTDGTYQGSLTATASKPGSYGMRVSLGGLKTQEYSSRTGATTTLPFYGTPHEGSYDIDIRAKPSAHTEVTLEVTQADAYGEDTTPFYDLFHVGYRNSSLKASVAIDSQAGVITLDAYSNQTKAAYNTFPNQSNYGNNQVEVVQLNDLVKLPDNNALRFGFEYRDNRESGALPGGALGYQVYAGSLMWNWRINQQFSVTAAGRVDHLDLTRTDPVPAGYRYTPAEFDRGTTVPSYNFGLVYTPTDSDTIRLLTGRAVQAPSLVDYGLVDMLHAGPTTIIYGGNPYLKPSITTNYELDYDKSVDAINSVLHTALYYNMAQDILSPSPNLPGTLSGGILQSYAANIGHSAAIGGEFGINGQANGWRWNLTYSLCGVRSKLTAAPPGSPFLFNNATPVSAVDASLGYGWNKWDVNVDGKWQSNFTDFRFEQNASGVVFIPVTVANYVTIDARIGYQLTPQLNLSVSGTQLAGQQITETSGLRVERRVLAAIRVDF